MVEHGVRGQAVDQRHDGGGVYRLSRGLSERAILYLVIIENGGNNGENQWQLERHLADHSLSPNDREKSAIPPSHSIMTRHSAVLFLQVLDHVLLAAIYPSGEDQHQEFQLQRVHEAEPT